MNSLSDWDRLADYWEDFGPPESPSSHDLESYRQRLLRHCSNKKQKVCILGSTIGLRRLFVDNPYLTDCQVHCIDWSSKIYDRMTNLGCIENPQEHYHCANWISFDLGKESFAAIVADKSINNLAFENWPALIDNLWNHLEPGGLLLHRVVFVNQKLRGMTFEEILLQEAQCIQSGTISLEDGAERLWDKCLSGSYFIGTDDQQSMSVGNYRNGIHACEEKLKGLHTPAARLFFMFLVLYEQNFSDVWPAITSDDFSRVLASRFEITHMLYSHDYEGAVFQPVIECRRR